VDRCALFVDASYVLADGAMAVHGTRRGESVSWDYEGLLQLLSGLARERSGLPVLRCYWYEATVDGRRTAEQDALADLPGIKLRVAKIRPGRREGVETEIHRDLATLARNNAISDALVVSAEEDLSQVIADVQDLGMRVMLVHIAVDGNWTISRALRQESDDIIEISGDHLRPYVELIAGAEPVPADEDGDLVAAMPLANGHAPAAASFQPMPAPSGTHAPPAIYTAPVVAEYQRPALQLPRTTAHEDREREERQREERTAPAAVNGEAQPAARQDIPARQDMPARQDIPARHDIYAAPVTSTWNRPESAPQSRARTVEEPGYVPGPQGSQAGQGSQLPQGSQVPQGSPGTPETGLSAVASEPAPASPTQLRRLPSARNGVNQGQPGPMGLAGATPMPSVPHVGQSQGQSLGQGQGQGLSQGQGQGGGHTQGQGSARSAPYSGPQPVVSPATPPGYQNGAAGGGLSLSEAVQAAHEEGQEFGGSVARDAPALWLEAVLARKPRMPSDLEARLLQGSALPIDFLLHDEVRHALRRGFWDALERTRR
jgi:NYN domain